jgi:hypothetical protein
MKTTKIVYIAHPSEEYYQKLEIGQMCEKVILQGEAENLRGRIWVKIAENQYNAFPPDCFITLAEWREQQINSILDE